MQTNLFVKVLLIISGIIGIGIGFGLLFFPVAFEASADIHLGADINILSEIRTPGGLLLVSGIIIFLGAFIAKLSYTSILLSGLIYLSYGLSRIVGVFMDGFPNESLIIAMVVELLVGIISVILLFRLNRKQINEN